MTMGNNRVIGIQLVVDDKGTTVLAKGVQETQKEFSKATQEAQKYGSALEMVDSKAGGLTSSMTTLNSLVGMVGGAFAALKLSQTVSDAIELAARYDTLGVSVQNLGKVAGYSSGYMDYQEQALRKTGIAAVEAREVLSRMTSAQIDLSKSSDLARIAQDAAVIGNLNSSESFKTLVYGIQSAQTEMLRTIGINVNFEDSYARLARELGRSTDSLTEQEKMQARVNVVMEAGKNIAGTYEAAMGTAGKQVKSFERYLADFEVEFGKAFQPALTELVAMATEKMKGLTEAVADPTIQTGLKGIGDGLVMVVRHLDDMAVAGAGATAVWAAYKIESGALTPVVQGVSTAISAGKAVLTEAGDAVKTYSMLQRNGFSASEAAALSLQFATEGLRTKTDALFAVVERHPFAILVTIIAAAVVAYYTLSKSSAEFAQEAQKTYETVKKASDAYQQATTKVNDLQGALVKYDSAIQAAGGNVAAEQKAVDALARLYPSLTGQYQTVGQAIANVDKNRRAMLEAAQAEQALKLAEKYETDNTALEQVNNTVGRATLLLNKYGEQQMHLQEGNGFEQWLWGLDNYTGSLNNMVKELISSYKTASEIKATNPQQAAEAGQLADQLRSVMDWLSKIKDISPAMREALQTALKDSGKAAKDVVTDFEVAWDELGSGKRLLTDKQAAASASAFSKASSEIKQLSGETSDYMRYMADLEYSANKNLLAAWPGLAEQVRDLRYRDATKTAAGEKEILVKAQYETGQATLDAVTSAISAKIALLQGGNTKERAEAAALQKELTGLVQSASQDRLGILEKEYSQGKISSDQLIAAYQQQMTVIDGLAIKDSERTKLKLDLQDRIVAALDKEYSRQVSNTQMEMELGTKSKDALLAVYSAEAAALDQMLAQGLIGYTQWYDRRLKLASDSQKEVSRLYGEEEAALKNKITLGQASGDALVAAYDAQIAAMQAANKSEADINAVRVKRQEAYYNTLVEYSDAWMAKEQANIDASKKSESDKLTDSLTLWTNFYSQRDKQVDATINYEKALLSNNLIPGWKVAFDEILLKQKSFNQLSYDAWKDSISSLTDYYNDAFYDIIKGKWDDLNDAFDNFCDALLKAWINVLAQMATQWTASGIASFLSGLSGGSINLNLTGNTNGTAGTLGTAGSLISSGSTLYKVGSWLGDATGLSGLFGGGGGMTAAEQASFLASYAGGPEAVAGAQLAASQYGIVEAGATAAQLEALGVATKSTTAAVEAATTAATSLSTSMLAVTGGAAALLVVGGLIAADLNASPDTTPEEARATISSSIEEMNRLSEIMQTNAEAAGMHDDAVMDLADTIKKMGDRAGLTEEQVDLLMQGTARLSAEMEAAAAAGNDELVASLQAQLAELESLGAQYGITTDGLSDYALGLAEASDRVDDLNKALDGFDGKMWSAQNSLESYTKWAQESADGQARLEEYLYETGAAYGLTVGEAQAYAQAIAQGTMTTEELRKALGDVAAAAGSAGALTADAAANVESWALKAGMGSSEATTFASAVDLLVAKYQAGTLTGEGLQTNLTSLAQLFGASADSVSGLVGQIVALIAQLQAIPTDVQASVTVTTYSQSVDLGATAGLSNLVSYGGGESYHSGGLITAHTGGWLAQLLAGNYITAHGGQYLGLTSEEVLVKALKKEYMLNTDATAYYGVDYLDRLNRKQIPREWLGGSGDVGATPSGNPRSTAQPQVSQQQTVNFAPVISVTYAGGKDDAKTLSRQLSGYIWKDFDRRLKAGEILGKRS